MQKQHSHIPENEPVISLTHIYDAPRELVWDAFTTPEHLIHWWGPDDFTIEHKSADIRLGGHWEFVMVGPDGKRWPNYMTFTEFTPMDAIAHIHGAAHKDDDENTFSSRITFTDQGDKTKVNMHMTLRSMQDRADKMAFGAHELGLQTLAKAETYIDASMRPK